MSPNAPPAINPAINAGVPGTMSSSAISVCVVNGAKKAIENTSGEKSQRRTVWIVFLSTEIPQITMTKAF
ncbi:MAG: hypothetical protein HOG19_10160 [Gammaproteobacteria bacterium]|nr:hypothetical protein [Gammaproteobacteria bacterium]